MKKILVISILAVILLSVSFTSISALTPENEQKLNDKIKSLEKKVKDFFAENTKLKNDIVKLKTENTKLKQQVISLQKTDQELKLNPTQNNGFSDLICKQDYGIVKMSGRYTNDANPTQGVMLKLILLDSNKKIVATGIGSITQMNAYETKYFDAVAFYEGSYSSCEVQIEYK